MNFVFQDTGVTVELPTGGRSAPPSGDCEVTPSRISFLVPVVLPASLMRKMSESQIRAMAFDRLPTPPDTVRTWLILPRIGWFSRRTATAWVIAQPSSHIKSSGDLCVSEDALLAALTFDRRFDRGGVLAFDGSGMLTLIGVAQGRKNAMVLKQFLGSGSAPVELPPGMSACLGKGSSFVYLNGGGTARDALSRFGAMVEQDAAAQFADALKTVIAPRRFRMVPAVVPVPKSPSAADPSGLMRRGLHVLRAAFVVLSLLLPFIALGTARSRHIRMMETIDRVMSDAYEKRFGARVPDPVMALRAKARQASEQTHAAVLPLSIWITALNRLGGQAESGGLRLDVASLDGARIEIRGSADDLKSVAQWVSNLADDPDLTEASLISSETRVSDKRTVFLVRAKLRSAAERRG